MIRYIVCWGYIMNIISSPLSMINDDGNFAPPQTFLPNWIDEKLQCVMYNEVRKIECLLVITYSPHTKHILQEDGDIKHFFTRRTVENS